MEHAQCPSGLYSGMRNESHHARLCSGLLNFQGPCVECEVNFGESPFVHPIAEEYNGIASTPSLESETIAVLTAEVARLRTALGISDASSRR